MSRHMDFVREAASEFPKHVRAADDVIVVPFSKTLGAVTGPTRDRDTLGGNLPGGIRIPGAPPTGPQPVPRGR